MPGKHWGIKSVNSILSLLIAEMLCAAVEVRADLDPRPTHAAAADHQSPELLIAGLLLSGSAVAFGLWMRRRSRKKTDATQK